MAVDIIQLVSNRQEPGRLPNSLETHADADGGRDADTIMCLRHIRAHSKRTQITLDESPVSSILGAIDGASGPFGRPRQRRSLDGNVQTAEQDAIRRPRHDPLGLVRESHEAQVQRDGGTGWRRRRCAR